MAIAKFPTAMQTAPLMSFIRLSERGMQSFRYLHLGAKVLATPPPFGIIQTRTKTKQSPSCVDKGAGAPTLLHLSVSVNDLVPWLIMVAVKLRSTYRAYVRSLSKAFSLQTKCELIMLIFKS